MINFYKGELDKKDKMLEKKDEEYKIIISNYIDKDKQKKEDEK